MIGVLLNVIVEIEVSWAAERRKCHQDIRIIPLQIPLSPVPRR